MKVGFMCEDDYAYELSMGLGAFLYPSLATVAHYCPSRVQVEVIPMALIESTSVRRRGRRPYFMREADLLSSEPFPEGGAFITDSIEDIWRSKACRSSEHRTIVAVRLRIIEIFSRNSLTAKAFVYEELYERLGLLHPHEWTKH